MKFSILICGLLFLVSCQNQVNSEVSEHEAKGKPSDVFVEYAKELKIKGQFHDTARVKKLGSYGLGDYTLIDKIPFYYLNYDETQITKTRTTTTPGIFKKVESVWAYFYREEMSGDNMIVDGVIEQWTFTNETDVKEAAEAFKKYGEEIFFNTTPYHCVKGNVLYIFHARAMAFSFPQKVVFEDFKKKL